MNITDLQTELQTGPLAAALEPLIEAGNDGAIAALLNAPYATATGAISRPFFAIWAAETGMRAVIRDHVLNTNSSLRSIAISLEDFLGGASDSLDFSKPANQNMLSAWVAAGGCTQEQANDLLSRAGQSISRAQQIFGTPVTIGQIAKALRG